MMTEIFREVDNPRLRMCLDVGHVNAYSPVPVGGMGEAPARDFSPISISTTMTALRIPIAPRGEGNDLHGRAAPAGADALHGGDFYTGSASGGTGRSAGCWKSVFGGVNMEEKLNKLLSAVSPLVDSR